MVAAGRHHRALPVAQERGGPRRRAPPRRDRGAPRQRRRRDVRRAGQHHHLFAERTAGAGGRHELPGIVCLPGCLGHPRPARAGHQAWYQPLNDIASDAGKIGGAAQARRAGAVLHHVTMSYDIDADKMVEVLRIGREKLSDKGTTSARKRVDPLRSQTGLARDTIIERMLQTFVGMCRLTPAEIGAATLQAAQRQAEEKFSSPEWTALVP
ncbi:hypothetical protein L535_2876 [Bordetella bronchiseptica SBL-F6116]|nr:hypothetical protein L535_2876 [Bordetella bronchiseptica SBL-F6116]